MLDVILDFFYVIAQKRLSSARILMKVGGTIFILSLGIGSLVGSFSFDEMTITADSANSPVSPILINILFFLGLVLLVVGVLLELKENFWGEASKSHRGKSIDLRSLPKGDAPWLLKSFSSTVESSGLHDDLCLQPNKDESTSDWLSRSTQALTNFAEIKLAKLNHHEREHPLALGALAHIPQCFALGFMIANQRDVNYYCWNRDSKKEEKSRWVDCRDKRTRGQSTKGHINIIKADSISEPSGVRKLGLSIELSIPSNPEHFLKNVGLDIVCQIGLAHQSIGNLFSEKEQVKIIGEIRELLNNQLLKDYPNVEELHITITGQASFVMRFGADLNQNHMPKLIKVYHFDKPDYPWCFSLSPNKDSVEFSLFENN